MPRSPAPCMRCTPRSVMTDASASRAPCKLGLPLSGSIALTLPTLSGRRIHRLSDEPFGGFAAQVLLCARKQVSTSVLGTSYRLLRMAAPPNETRWLSKLHGINPKAIPIPALFSAGSESLINVTTLKCAEHPARSSMCRTLNGHASFPMRERVSCSSDDPTTILWRCLCASTVRLLPLNTCQEKRYLNFDTLLITKDPVAVKFACTHMLLIPSSVRLSLEPCFCYLRDRLQLPCCHIRTTSVET